MSDSHEQSAGGFEHIYQPGKPGTPASATTLLLLHGTGGDENDLVALGRQLAPESGLLSPRGKVLEGGVSRRFFRRLAIGELDIPDLLARTDELADFVNASAGTYGFDPTRIVALGFSNGANIATSLLFRHPGLLSGAALLRPMLPYEPDPGLSLNNTRVFVAAGGQDPYVPPGQSRQLAEVLTDAGATVELRMEDSAGHGLTQGDFQALSSWLASS
ncbi:MAG: alpha/beta hydrolase [Solirubrobacterales bacterium]